LLVLRRGYESVDSAVVSEADMTVLWHALFNGELCRIREATEGRLISEVWRNGRWREGPDFSSMDFTGRAIDRHQADEWIRTKFKDKTLRTPQGVGDRSS
jgi:hypothetical protein